ncbi:major facilitator superfamily domain-containing protein [Lineolata rhizophorae]|uniref:Major facilitator superfamily domain-containing protein n=1 Tax=Lineolata rhizophorae TaxID=578093 RepID=A0A6A6NLP1_9PEZI|nr:major facilitator superfamily domain-containing protein [Lineolata rhizophorae]
MATYAPELPQQESGPSIDDFEEKSNDKDEEEGQYNAEPDEQAPAERPRADTPPNGGYGWVCVACVFIVNGHTWGLNSSYGVFLAHYLSTNTFPNASPLDFAFIGGLSISMALLISPLGTIITRLYGTRATLSLGIVFQTASLLGASFASRIWHLYLSQGLCFGWGMGFLFVATVGVVPQWFTTRRSLANGIATAGSGLGGLVYSLAANRLIATASLGWAFRVLCFAQLGANAAATALLRDRNAAIGSALLPFDARLFRQPPYALLLCWASLCMLGYVVLLFSLPNYAEARLGLSPAQGSVLGALLNLGQAVGRPPIGYFSDAVGRLNMATVMTALAGALCLLVWVFARSFGVMVVFSLVGGMVAGTMWATAAPVATEVVGLRELPAALSILWVVLAVPSTFSEAIALEMVERAGGEYLGAQLFTGFMYVSGAGCLWLLRAWKLGEVDAGMDLIEGERSGGADGRGEKRTVRDRKEFVRMWKFKNLWAWRKV